MRSGDGGRPPNVILISSSQTAIFANYYLFGPAVAVAFLLSLLLVDDEDGAYCSILMWKSGFHLLIIDLFNLR